MEVKEFYSIEDKEYWLNEIKKSDWGAGQYLHDLSCNNELKELGFVYTFPPYRGHRYMGTLLAFAYAAAKSDGARQLYISTGETGIYKSTDIHFIV